MQNLNETLIDVRKAYRLLFDFQSRILDLVSFIGGTLDFGYQGGYVKFCASTPRDGKGELKLWAWDWLPMYCYDFRFKTRDNIDFAVFLVSDTGFFDACAGKESYNNNDKINLEKFKPVEESKTKLILVAGVNGWEKKFNQEKWGNVDFLTKEFEKDPNHLALFKSYELSKFIDENTALETLKDFQTICQKHGINIAVKERELQ